MMTSGRRDGATCTAPTDPDCPHAAPTLCTTAPREAGAYYVLARTGSPRPTADAYGGTWYTTREHADQACAIYHAAGVTDIRVERVADASRPASPKVRLRMSASLTPEHSSDRYCVLMRTQEGEIVCAHADGQLGHGPFVERLGAYPAEHLDRISHPTERAALRWIAETLTCAPGLAVEAIRRLVIESPDAPLPQRVTQYRRACGAE